MSAAMNEELHNLSLKDIIPGNESAYGLVLENTDERRQIYRINNSEIFLSKTAELNIGFLANKLRDLLAKYPDSLAQLFLVTPTGGESVTLGQHYHTPEAEGGNGQEIFIIVDVAPGASITAEQYHLGKSHGSIKYGLESGDIIENSPMEYHVFKANGPFSMIQISQNRDFIPDDLNKFEVDQFSPEDKRFVEGTIANSPDK